MNSESATPRRRPIVAALVDHPVRPADAPTRAAALLVRAADAQLGGDLTEAADAAARALAESVAAADDRAAADACRRLAVLHHLQGRPGDARAHAMRSLDLARGLPDRGRTAEALHVLAGLEMEAGAVATARGLYGEALELGHRDPALVARIEQNVGILASMQGDLDAAVTHYLRALRGFEALRDERGCGMVYHNLGMIAADRAQWAEAYRHYGRCLHLARSSGDRHLQGLAHLNQSEVHMALDRIDDARRNADSALEIFERLDSPADTADAFRVLGVIFRKTGRLALAEARLRAAVDGAAEAGAVLTEGEAALELARLYDVMDRRAEAIRFAARARRIFHQVGAATDLAAASELQERLEAA